MGPRAAGKRQRQRVPHPLKLEVTPPHVRPGQGVSQPAGLRPVGAHGGQHFWVAPAPNRQPSAGVEPGGGGSGDNALPLMPPPPDRPQTAAFDGRAGHAHVDEADRVPQAEGGTLARRIADDLAAVSVNSAAAAATAVAEATSATDALAMAASIAAAAAFEARRTALVVDGLQVVADGAIAVAQAATSAARASATAAAIAHARA
jgi:hypothetical protein